VGKDSKISILNKMPGVACGILKRLEKNSILKKNLNFEKKKI